jgi:hypothetical protein
LLNLPNNADGSTGLAQIEHMKELAYEITLEAQQ